MAKNEESKGFELVRNSVYAVGALFVVAIAGVFAVGFIDGDASTISAMLTAVTGVIGSLVGAYFGIQQGNQGREQAVERVEDRRQAAEETSRKALGLLSPEDAAVVLGMELPTRSEGERAFNEPPSRERERDPSRRRVDRDPGEQSAVAPDQEERPTREPQEPQERNEREEREEREGWEGRGV